jgi:ribonuclease HII
MSAPNQNQIGDLGDAQPMDFFERRYMKAGARLVAGIDEAGRGPLAGPVVAGAVILPFPGFREAVSDSKKLTPEKRDYFYERITETALAVGIGIVDAEEIDRINIGRATQKAMMAAVHQLQRQPDLLLIDGIMPLPLPLPQRTIVKGDNLSVSIAAASIIAKVTRDRIMIAYHEQYPEYNFARHKGYGTREHRQAIRMHGWCEVHRKTYRGVLQPPSPLSR